MMKKMYDRSVLHQMLCYCACQSTSYPSFTPLLRIRSVVDSPHLCQETDLPHLFRQTNPNLGMSISISCFLSFFKEKGLVTLEHSWKVDDERVRSPHLCFYFLTGGRGALV